MVSLIAAVMVLGIIFGAVYVTDRYSVEIKDGAGNLGTAVNDAGGDFGTVIKDLVGKLPFDKIIPPQETKVASKKVVRPKEKVVKPPVEEEPVTPPSEPASPAIKWFLYASGESLTFWNVTGEESVGYITELTEDIHGTADKTVIYLTRDTLDVAQIDQMVEGETLTIACDPPIKILDKPLDVGRSWNSESVCFSPTGENEVRFLVSANVVGQNPVSSSNPRIAGDGWEVDVRLTLEVVETGDSTETDFQYTYSDGIDFFVTVPKLFTVADVTYSLIDFG